MSGPSKAPWTRKDQGNSINSADGEFVVSLNGVSGADVRLLLATPVLFGALHLLVEALIPRLSKRQLAEDPHLELALECGVAALDVAIDATPAGAAPEDAK